MLRALQIIQNKAAKAVAKPICATPTRTILKSCGWLSVRQLLVYHSLVVLNKTFANKAPKYMYDKVTAAGKFNYNTR